MRVAVVTFPGSNCDYDCYKAVRDVLAEDAFYVWHRETDIRGADAIVLPGGFSYGDYLRAGAIARFSPILAAVRDFAEAGGPVLGICNGFQILCEAGLLPGALVRNASLQFRAIPVHVRVERADTPYTSRYRQGDVLRIPIAHGEGNYIADDATLDRLEADGRVVFRYVDRHGEPTEAANPNGSARSIAGIMNGAGNVMGLMPHPERAVEAILESTDGLGVFESLRDHVHASAHAAGARGGGNGATGPAGSAAGAARREEA